MPLPLPRLRSLLHLPRICCCSLRTYVVITIVLLFTVLHYCCRAERCATCCTVTTRVVLALTVGVLFVYVHLYIYIWFCSHYLILFCLPLHVYRFVLTFLPVLPTVHDTLVLFLFLLPVTTFLYVPFTVADGFAICCWFVCLLFICDCYCLHCCSLLFLFCCCCSRWWRNNRKATVKARRRSSSSGESIRRRVNVDDDGENNL